MSVQENRESTAQELCAPMKFADSCRRVFVYENELGSGCVACIQRALNDPSVNKREEIQEIDQDAYPPSIERVSRDAMCAIGDGFSYNRVFKRETGPLCSDTGKLVLEKTLYAHFKCEPAEIN